MSSILKNWRVVLLIFFVVVCIFSIGPNINPVGVKIIHKDKNSTLPLYVNDIIYSVNGDEATVEMFDNNYTGVITIQSSRGTIVTDVNGSLGLTVDDVPFTNLKFGLDLEGGVRAVIKPNITDNQTMDQVVSVLENRIGFYGLRESKFRKVYGDDKGFVEIIMAGGTKDELRELLEHQGKFEAKIPLLINLDGNHGSLVLDKTYELFLDNGTLVLNNYSITEGDRILLSGIDVVVDSIEKNRVNLTTTVFKGSDVIFVYRDPQHAGVQRLGEGTGYRWYFQVKLSNNAAKNFAYITNNLERVFEPGSGEGYLSSRLYLFLDDRLVDTLNIASDLKGREVSEPSVTGYGSTPTEAIKSQKTLQSILSSGSLPTSIELVQLDVISANLGVEFLESVLIAIVLAVITVSIIIAIRYRKLKIVFPMLAISMSEIVIILGLSVYGWTIDLASLAGLIAIIGTGIDSQIIIIDQAIKGGNAEISMKQKRKRAFFIIFGAAGTTFAAMLPLMFLGLGVLQGFAIITIVGVLVRVFITRPAFGENIKRIV